MTEDGKDVLVLVEENIVASTSQNLKQMIKDAISPGMKTLILDLDRVEQVDSIGMGVLIAAYNTLRKENIEFKLVNVGENIYDLFRVMRLDKHFEVEIKA
ncbi:STAS domain-containing protein [Desulfonatronovibrio hydrogenovorans]|uniref:STAS domain-containing protein n=1 Tax=Desulfonatronovibrio hydrogenovorans TaxID=53245 RepID=UPI00048B3537|nr:STAS domain-containing protein [Desulfonatronovibrio hydrogenovorans]